MIKEHGKPKQGKNRRPAIGFAGLRSKRGSYPTTCSAKRDLAQALDVRAGMVSPGVSLQFAFS
jgi:hypothetical protein